ncbi:hypothetical protein PLESTB_001313800 [Pleodorina starrii]|uniref:Uncharacterized protein n=1 Tax=Pleodorina starrii TaxID=330485 RepID=A0A9W6BTV7_9CHLO|nr:hypothetical protein PLESTB_001313800 [Pleodorina starrii]
MMMALPVSTSMSYTNSPPTAVLASPAAALPPSPSALVLVALATPPAAALAMTTEASPNTATTAASHLPLSDPDDLARPLPYLQQTWPAECLLVGGLGRLLLTLPCEEGPWAC